MAFRLSTSPRSRAPCGSEPAAARVVRRVDHAELHDQATKPEIEPRLFVLVLDLTNISAELVAVRVVRLVDHAESPGDETTD